MIGPRRLPPSRQGKKQIVAFLDPATVEAAHARRRSRSVTLQELVGASINNALGQFGREPLIEIRRDRLVRRERALAKVQVGGAAALSRTGKRRMAAWFDADVVNKVGFFASEVGLRVEDLVEMGVRAILSEDDTPERISPVTIRGNLEASE